MGSDHYQRLSTGDLVYMREWDDESGWKIIKDQIFMILDVKRERAHDLQDLAGRDVVRFSGGAWEGETLSGYFVRCNEVKE